ncbi:hydrolase [Geodermatophilaceae bacterium NBWT11]|nr:hydrolase [Geodermatophilaceae bacterium NBWT11]
MTGPTRPWAGLNTVAGAPDVSGVPAPSDPRAVAQARARARARARAQVAARRARAQRRARARALRRAALGRLLRRCAAVAGVLALTLTVSVALAGVRPETPAAASAPLELTAAATALRAELAGTAAAVLAGSTPDAPATSTDLALTAALAGLRAAPTSPDQQAVDDAARVAWQTRLADLAAAGIELPTAAAVAAGDLPEGLSPATDALGLMVPGVVEGVVGGRVVAVPTVEAALAVGTALASLGTPYVPGGTSPAGTDCTGLTATVWAGLGRAVGTTFAAQWSAGTVVPEGQWQPGDLVFGSHPDAGLDDVGVYVGAGEVVTASATAHQVAVLPAAPGAAAVRVTVPPAVPNTPPPSDGSTATVCGAAPVSAATGPVSPAWGGWANGQIPTSALCAIGAGHRLRCDAAAAYAGLAEAFQNAFHRPICITDSYRSLAAQVDAHERKPAITAVPGTSNHGWGLAVDLCGGVNGFDTPEHAWMARWAPTFGWTAPDWARAAGSNPEPWHWEYGSLA